MRAHKTQTEELVLAFTPAERALIERARKAANDLSKKVGGRPRRIVRFARDMILQQVEEILGR